MSLSDKRQEKLKRNRNPYNKFYYIYPEEDVKEFIRKLKEMIAFEVQPLPSPKSISDRLNSQIDKLAGKELI